MEAESVCGSGGETTTGTSSYRGGETPYHNSRGGRGGKRRNEEGGSYRSKRQEDKKPANAEDQFNMLFGGPSKQDKAKAAVPVDDAIIIEDDAIVIEDDAVIVEPKQRKNSNIDALNALIGDTKGASKNLNDNDIAIITAAQQKPLWVEENRPKFTRKQLLENYTENTDIDFTLFDENYITVFEIFN